MSELNYTADINYYEECIEIVICSSCKGTGVGSVHHPVCDICNGSGTLIKTTICTYKKTDKDGIDKLKEDGMFKYLGRVIFKRGK